VYKLAPKDLCTIYARHLTFRNSMIYAGHPVARGPAQKRVHLFGGQQNLQEGSSQDSWFLIAYSSDKQPLTPTASGKLWLVVVQHQLKSWLLVCAHLGALSAFFPNVLALLCPTMQQNCHVIDRPCEHSTILMMLDLPRQGIVAAKHHVVFASEHLVLID